MIRVCAECGTYLRTIECDDGTKVTDEVAQLRYQEGQDGEIVKRFCSIECLRDHLWKMQYERGSYHVYVFREGL